MCINEEENIVSKKTNKNKNKSVNQYEVGTADLEKVSGGAKPNAGRTKRMPPKEAPRSAIE